MAKKGPIFISDLFTKFEFDIFSNSETIEDKVKLEYIKEMISLAKSDKQAVFMYFAFSLATVAFLIEKLDSAVECAGQVCNILFYSGITLLLLSTVFFFSYWRKIHRAHINIVSCIPRLNIEKTRNLWMQLWEENRRYFKLGLLFLSIGIVLLFSVILISKVLL